VVLPAEQDREPHNMISSSDVMLLHSVGTPANGATQLFRSPNGIKPNGPRGPLPRELQIAPVRHQEPTNEE